MYNRERNGDNEYRARFRFRRPDRNVYPYRRDTPDDVFPHHDHDETDEVHEKDDTESSPLMVRVLIRFSRLPSVTKFNADGKNPCQPLSGRNHGTYNNEYGNMTWSGRTKKNLKGAWMNATSNGRFLISGRW